MLTGTLITTAGFIPVGFAASTAGEYVRTLFYVVGIALVVSWFVAVYFTPWLGHMILKQRQHAGDGHHDVFDTRFYRRLRATVALGVRHRGIVLALTLVAFATSLCAFQFIPQNFFPQSSRPEILVDLWLPEGTSIKEVEAQAKALRSQDDGRSPTSASSPPISAKARRASSCRSTSSCATRTSPSFWSWPRT